MNDDKSPDPAEDKGGAVVTLPAKTPTISITSLAEEEMRKANLPYHECPLIFSYCIANGNVDGDCIGGNKKYLGCHTFINMALNSPPSGFDYRKPIQPQLEAVREKRKSLETSIIKRKDMLSRVQNTLDQDTKKLNELKSKYFSF